ncbi:TPA: hypothetical protein NJ576_000647 [Vibrio parahaemolyticus]|nr:hypothetical protein [Vibrio parahaemolyticus]HCE4571542.1 hypothetical protein [Vibrio parahaemolyticus]HCG8619995.1 hypothetical protein [Vibrio parahaemolyticus]HCM1425263.1 hypothetical protein [Vibrio parahaemolyticus]
MLMSSDTAFDVYLNTFTEGLTQIRAQSRDSFHNQLYFSNVISLMEQYLSNLFIFEITNSPESLRKLASHDKFRSATVTVPFALNNPIDEYLIHSMKALVWHRLNDVEMYYKKVLGIRFNISIELLKQLELRHDLVHRNGHTLDGDKVDITDGDLDQCIALVELFVLDIHAKYVAQKS